MSKLYGGLCELRNGGMNFDDVLTYYGELPLSAFILKTVNITKKEGNKMARIRNQAILDLRQFTPEALKKIKSIKRVATVILPENMSPEFTEVYAGIKKTMVAKETVIPANACIHNGSTILTKSDVTENNCFPCLNISQVKKSVRCWEYLHQLSEAEFRRPKGISETYLLKKTVTNDIIRYYKTKEVKP